MPWEYLLSGAGGAGIVVVLMLLFAKQFIEKSVDHHFGLKVEEFRAAQNNNLEEFRAARNRELEQLRGQFTRTLEFDKSDLAVWADLRKSILVELWNVHREIAKSMTEVILAMQKAQWQSSLEKEKQQITTTIDAYRQGIHQRIDLLSPPAVQICQDFLDTGFDMANGKRAIDDANPLKRIRGKFASSTAQFFGLEKMMPWMAGGERETTAT